jgi:hypothetical protein
MSRNDLLPYFNTNLYNLLDSDDLRKEHKDKKITLKQIIEDIMKKNLSPVLIACGPTVLKDYFDKVKKDK